MLAPASRARPPSFDDALLLALDYLGYSRRSRRHGTVACGSEEAVASRDYPSDTRVVAVDAAIIPKHPVAGFDMCNDDVASEDLRVCQNDFRCDALFTASAKELPIQGLNTIVMSVIRGARGLVFHCENCGHCNATSLR